MIYPIYVKWGAMFCFPKNVNGLPEGFKVNPITKLEDLSPDKLTDMFLPIEATISEMRKLSGRNTEKDLYEKNKGYVTILSSKTIV